MGRQDDRGPRVGHEVVSVDLARRVSAAVLAADGVDPAVGPDRAGDLVAGRGQAGEDRPGIGPLVVGFDVRSGHAGAVLAAEDVNPAVGPQHRRGAGERDRERGRLRQSVLVRLEDVDLGVRVAARVLAADRVDQAEAVGRGGDAAPALGKGVPGDHMFEAGLKTSTDDCAARRRVVAAQYVDLTVTLTVADMAIAPGAWQRGRARDPGWRGDRRAARQKHGHR